MSDVRRYVTEDVLEGYARKQDLPEIMDNSYEGYALLGRYQRNDTTTMPEEEKFTLTFSESINNYAMLFICVRAELYVMGSSFLPTAFFKSGIQFELNCMNDIEKTYHGNLKYESDTMGSGKISGYASAFEVYGFLKI